MGAELSAPQAQDVVRRFFSRRDRFPDEGEERSLMMVLLNYGDHLTAVRCIGGEWRGTKGDLTPREGIPLCPDNHPLIEMGPRWRLGLVVEEALLS